MRFDSLFDAFYLAGSLLGVPRGPQVCAVSPNPPHEHAARPVTAFVNVNVVPMDTERVLERQTVLIEGGRITALGPASMIAVPEGAARIDGRNKYLIPGLGDAHLHSYGPGSYSEYLGHLADGVTTVRMSGVSGGSREALRYRRAVEETDALSPRVYIPMQTALDSDSLFSSTVERRMEHRIASLAEHLAEYKEAGYDLVGFSPRWPRPAADSLRAAARRLGMPLVHHGNDDTFEEMLAMGPTGSVEHIYAFMNGTRNALLVDTSQAGLRAIAQATKRAGSWVTLTLVCQIRFRSAVNLRPLIQALQEAGVGMLSGSDYGDDRTLPVELTAMVRFGGLTPYQALLTSTRNVAQFLGLLDSAGTVAVGKRADLVLLYGNPLQEIESVQEPAGVMIDGRWIDRAALDEIMLNGKRDFREEWERDLYPLRGRIPETQFHRYTANVVMLVDSLAAVPSLDRATYERLLRRQAEEIAAMRALLQEPAHRATFDSKARVWMRKQARKGYPVTIRGVAPVP